MGHAMTGAIAWHIDKTVFQNLNPKLLCLRSNILVMSSIQMNNSKELKKISFKLMHQIKI